MCAKKSIEMKTPSRFSWTRPVSLQAVSGTPNTPRIPVVDVNFRDAILEACSKKSPAPLRRVMTGEDFDNLIDFLKALSYEIDDSRKPLGPCAALLPYQDASKLLRTRLHNILKLLAKEDNGYSVFEVLVQWGIFNRHENLALLKDNTIPERRFFHTSLEQLAQDLVSDFARDFKTTDRVDLRGRLKSFAIDGKGTREVDDSISYDVNKNCILVNIADPTEYISGGIQNPLVREAQRRVQSIYAVREKSPMFPESVATKVFSLAQRNRSQSQAITFEFHIDSDGYLEKQSASVYESTIDTPIRMSYKQANEAIHSTKHPFHKDLKRLFELARARNSFRDRKAKRKGSAVILESRDSKEARLLVTEMMITANITAGIVAQRVNVPVLFRGMPERGNCESSLGTAQLSASFQVSAASRTSKMDRGPKVKLDTYPLKHLDLGVDVYVQATSPIRKFIDLLSHFQLKAKLASTSLPFSARELKTFIPHIQYIERVSSNIERRMTKYWQYEKLRVLGQRTLHKGTAKQPTRAFVDAATSHLANGKRIWLVFLTNHGCTIPATAPFNLQPGTTVEVKITFINPRTSFVEANAHPKGA